MYQCGRCGLTRASGQEIGVIQKCKCPWEFVPPTPPQRTWVGLTDEDIGMCLDAGDGSMSKIISFIEAKLKEKNSA